MGNYNDILLVLGSLRYKSAPDVDFGLKVPFVQSGKNYIELDRSATVNLQQVYDDERQKSALFRPVAKLTLIFSNSYTGSSTYTPFTNSLYYTNAEIAAAANCQGDPAVWEGFPQYHEFDFIRSDFNTIGYTQPPDNHLKFKPKDASKYNWNFYMTYASENDINQTCSAKLVIPDFTSPVNVSWVVSDGVPFAIKLKTLSGMKIIQLWCPIKHGVQPGEYVKFKSPFNFNGVDLIEVYKLGNGTVGSEDYVINILDPGYSGIFDGDTGIFKRVILSSNLTETTSEYYVRRHKILTNATSSVVVNSGYEQNIFKTVAKYERPPYTPNQVGRISLKEGGQTYTLSFNTDVDLTNLVDNQKRPISKLYYTIIWKGYFGWTKSLKQGWDFNLPVDPTTQQPTTRWEDGNTSSNTGLPTNSYNTTGPIGVNPLGVPYSFIYTENLSIGDSLDGNICEWNDYTQLEQDLSTYYNKIRFNENLFNISMGSSSNPFGYYYQPHNEIEIAAFSNYLEEGSSRNIDGLPDWAHYSENRDVFVWRDKYPYGYIDSDNIGVNWPFMNGRHHPYKNIIFRIIPEGTNYSEYTRNNATTQTMLTDGCE